MVVEPSRVNEEQAEGATLPTGMWEVWTMSRPHVQEDVEMRVCRREMRAALLRAMGKVARAIPGFEKGPYLTIVCPF